MLLCFKIHPCLENILRKNIKILSNVGTECIISAIVLVMGNKNDVWKGMGERVVWCGLYEESKRR